MGVRVAGTGKYIPDGVVTNEHRHFVHTAQISELATEMKAYAKTFSGSIYVVDRRHGGPQGSAGGEAQ